MQKKKTPQFYFSFSKGLSRFKSRTKQTNYNSQNCFRYLLYPQGGENLASVSDVAFEPKAPTPQEQQLHVPHYTLSDTIRPE